MFYHFLTFLATPVLAQDDYGLSVTAGTAKLTQFGGNLPTLIGTVLGTALSLVGVLFFALMLYGGITWMLAHGNAEQEKKALGTITAAIIGILIVLGSYALTTFVLGSVKSAGGGKEGQEDGGGIGGKETGTGFPKPVRKPCIDGSEGSDGRTPEETSWFVGSR